MQAKAINGEFADGEQQYYAKRFSAYDAARPAAAALFELTQEQLKALGLGTNAGSLLPVLNRSINGQFSSLYPELMNAIGLSQYHHLTDLRLYTCVLLVYDWDMILVLATPDDFMMYTTGFMSTKEIAESFCEEYVLELLGSVGLTEVSVAVYRDEALENLRTCDTYYQFDPYGLTKSSAVSTEKSMAQLLPYLVNSGLVDENDAASGWIEQYLRDHDDSEESVIPAMRFISEIIVPGLEKLGASEWGRRDVFTPVAVSAADLSYFPEQEGAIEPGDTAPVLYRDEDEDVFKINTYLTAALARVPASVEEADKILLISTHWEKTGTNNGVTVFRAVSRITLHDGQTGLCLMTLEQQEDEMTGFHMVSGNEYYESVHWDRVAELIFAFMSEGET